MCIHADCLHHGRPRLLATVGDMWSATGARNSHRKRWHDGYARDFGMIEMKSNVYIVDAPGRGHPNGPGPGESGPCVWRRAKGGHWNASVTHTS